MHVDKQSGKDPHLVLLLKLLEAQTQSLGVVPRGFLENATEGLQRCKFPKIHLKGVKLELLSPNAGILLRDAHVRNLG
jgi:hypothetical protein